MTDRVQDAAVTDRLGLDEATAVPLYVLGAGNPVEDGDAESTSAGLTAFRRRSLA